MFAKILIIPELPKQTVGFCEKERFLPSERTALTRGKNRSFKKIPPATRMLSSGRYLFR